MIFHKMHGTGNDYVCVDCIEENPETAKADNSDLAALAVKISDRHCGVGSDGLILILPSEIADCRMRIFNSDGSEAEMCGNGVRCVAKYACEKGIAHGEKISVETGAGVLAHPLKVLDREFKITCVSMGNPHCVVFVDDVNSFPVEKYGPAIENHIVFPNRTNVEFVTPVNAGEVLQRTWERGAGETPACGTGASAVCVASTLNNLTGKNILVHLTGGDLEIELSGDGTVRMTGPAEYVFRGEWPL